GVRLRLGRGVRVAVSERGGGGGRDGLGDHCTAPLAGVVEQLSESRAQGSPALAAHLAPRAGEALARLRGGRRMTLGQAAHEEQGSRGQLVRRIGRERGEAIARHVGVLVRAELILQTPQRLELVFRRFTEYERAGLDRIAQLLRTTAD